MLRVSHDDTTNPLSPLFSIDAEYQEFKERHSKETVKKSDLKTYKGDVYVGIDAGSTTTKLVAIDQDRSSFIFALW